MHLYYLFASWFLLGFTYRVILGSDLVFLRIHLWDILLRHLDSAASESSGWFFGEGKVSGLVADRNSSLLFVFGAYLLFFK